MILNIGLRSYTHYFCWNYERYLYFRLRRYIDKVMDIIYNIIR